MIKFQYKIYFLDLPSVYMYFFLLLVNILYVKDNKFEQLVFYCSLIIYYDILYIYYIL